jgi:hypothetical protein
MEKLVIVESITATTVKVNMKRSEIFLVSLVNKGLVSLPSHCKPNNIMTWFGSYSEMIP